MDDEQNIADTNYKSICCTKIPEIFLDKLVAKMHFGRFGKINRFILRPKRLSCTVEYETEDAAERALLQAGDFHGHEFVVEYAKHEVGHVQNTEEWVDPDVQAELDAMKPGHLSASLHIRPVAPAPAPIPSMKPTRVFKPAAVQTMVKAAGEPVPQPAAAKIDNALRNELEALLRRPAYTNEDKYRVLDARDKLIRLATVRQTDIKKAVSTRGICPDMCPEKERLMRDFQRQVSSFEMDDGGDGSATISHHRAIKEYSRSSADQEVPLPHELRSEDVLQMTMLYLMHCIMDLCDDPNVSLGDWFHFVWDRTRSIRKEITQQELCSLAAVQLVEQCARFHIHCAARLAGEEPSVFDKKINAENLTKCLQTLKYMYHDLRIKNIVCPCEAEFRSYIVLLNLGDANFLWEVKQLPTHIQDSVGLKCAIAFYNALQNNNYVRFFDMVRSPQTSYLSACILLSYFNKLRLRAMEVIYKAHNWRKSLTVMPLAHLANVLGFESDEAAADFFQYHGWQCDEDRVMLDSLKRPDIEYLMERALELVESKRSVSVGECICGHPLDAAAIFEQHQPHSSFDINGFLTVNAWTAEDQLRGEAAAEIVLQRRQQPAPQPPKSLPLSKAPPPTIKTDSSLFKVPQASPPISPRQQQQQHLARQQQKFMTPAIFGGISLQTPSSSGTSSYVSPGSDSADSTASSLYMPAGNSTSIFNTASIFKPIVSDGATLSAFGSGSIFGSAVAGPASNSSGMTANIFGGAANRATNIFRMSSKVAAMEPQPMLSDNVFQHFSTMGKFPAPSPATNIFGAANLHTTEMAYHQQQADMARRHAAAEQRQRELQSEQLLKQQQLEEERRKLKLLEEQRAAQLQAEAAAEAARRREQIEQLNAMAQTETKRQMDALLAAEIATIAQAELVRHETYERQCQQLLREILSGDLQAQIVAIANEEYAVMCHDQMILHRYLARWLQETRKRIQQRELIESTPIWATADTRQQLAEWMRHPSEQANLQMIKRYRHGSPCDFQALLRWPGAPAASPAPPLDIFAILAKHSSGSESARMYYKLLLALPEEREELPGCESLYNRWLGKYLRRPPTNEHDEAYICAMEADVALCVRKVSGGRARNEQGRRVSGECSNADSVVFFMSCSHLANTRRRLQQLLKLAGASSGRGIPVAFVVYDAEWFSESQLTHALQVDALAADGQIAAYKFHGCALPKDRFHFDTQLGRALHFVAKARTRSSDALEMESLPSWLEANLGEEMWRRWQQSTERNPAFAKFCSMPQPIVALHNEALQRLLDMITVDWLPEADFPRELDVFVSRVEGDMPRGLPHFPADWKDPTRQQRLADLLKAMRLPPCSDDLPDDVDSWELWLLNYAGACIPHEQLAKTEAAYEAIKALIEQLNRTDLQELTVRERLPLISFLPVMKRLAFAHVNNVLQNSAGARKTPKELVYRRNTLLAYQQEPWWLNCRLLEEVTVDYTLPYEDEACVAIATAQQRAQHLAEMQQVLQQAESISRRSDENVHDTKKQQYDDSSHAADASTTELKRKLDESLNQFELAKKCGAYENGPMATVEQAVNSRDSATPEISPDQHRKRKHDEGETNEVQAVIARALSLIKQMEKAHEDRKSSNI